MRSRWRSAQGHFLSHVGSAVASQAMLSAANFTTGLLLLRSAGAQPYAHYVLAMNSIALMVSLQTAFLGPPLATRLPSLPDQARATLIGGLLNEQGRLLQRIGGLAALAAVLLALYTTLGNAPNTIAARVDPFAIPLVLFSSLLAMVGTLRREFLRQTLLALRRAHDIFRADFLFALTLIIGALIARYMPLWLAPAVVLLALALGSLGSRLLLQLSLHQQFKPPAGRQPQLLQEIIPLALWSTSGAAFFWLYTQGFLYLVAAKLGTTAVATLAATRLLLMPMNLLSSGLGGLLAPAAAGWLAEMGRLRLLQRLAAIAVAMGVLTSLWVAALDYWQQPLFTLLFRQPLAHAEALLLSWGAVYISMALRDQLGYLLAALGQYRQLTLLTALATLVSLSCCLIGMSWLPDPRGAMIGIVAGEGLTLVGIVTLVWRAVQQTPPLSPDEIASRA